MKDGVVEWKGVKKRGIGEQEQWERRQREKKEAGVFVMPGL